MASEKIDSRAALIIGNGDYNAGRLKNSVNDAKEISKVLKNLKFDVTSYYNLNRREILKAVENFKRKTKNIDTVLFYYSGHGIQLESKNYLVPIGADLSSEIDAASDSVKIDRVIGKIAETPRKNNIIILDACRDNPFYKKYKTSEKGLTSNFGKVVNTLIAFATSPGEVALDDNSYTKTLIKYLKLPGFKIEEILKFTRREVAEKTGGKQIPWDSSSLTFSFYPGGNLVSHAASFKEEKSGYQAEHKSNSRFVDNNDGTITDNKTGLMWSKTTSKSKMSWEDAKTYCDVLNKGGYDDWRLPTKNELLLLVNKDFGEPAINTVYFPDTEKAEYWTDTIKFGFHYVFFWTPYSKRTGYLINFGSGNYVSKESLIVKKNVRPVRFSSNYDDFKYHLFYYLKLLCRLLICIILILGPLLFLIYKGFSGDLSEGVIMLVVFYYYFFFICLKYFVFGGDYINNN